MKTSCYLNWSSSLSYLFYNCSIPNMMEAYLWKGSNGHFPLPSSLLFSRVSIPSAKDCTDQHLWVILHTLYQFIQCGIWMKISSSEFFSPYNHTPDQKRWFHTHTSCRPLSCAGPWYSSYSPSRNVFQKQWLHLLNMQNIFKRKKLRKGPTSGSFPLFLHSSFCFGVTSHFT